jgi:hypothetical protein
MKMSTVCLVIQGGLAGYILNVAFPLSEMPWHFVLAIFINSLLVVSYCGFKAAEED